MKESQSFEQCLQDFKVLGILQGSLHLDLECIYGNNPAGAYLGLVQKLSQLLPADQTLTDLSQDWHHQQSPAVIYLNFCYQGQPLRLFFERHGDYAQLALISVWNLAGAKLCCFGSAGDPYFIWGDQKIQTTLTQRGWQPLDLSPPPPFIALQLQWLLRSPHDPVTQAMQDLYLDWQDHFSPACWVYYGALLQAQKLEAQAWEAWSHALQAGLVFPFTDQLDSILLTQR